MSGKNIYGNLFREFMPLGSASASSGWNTATSANPINWATSQIGNKAAFFDNQKKLLYFVADVNNVVIDQLIALANAGSLNSTQFNTLVQQAVFGQILELNKDPLYAAAISVQADIDSKSTSFTNWIQNLVPGIELLNKTGKVPFDLGVVSLQYDNPRNSYYDNQATTNTGESIAITQKAPVNGTLAINGRGGLGDTLTVSAGLKDTLSKTQKDGITINLISNTFQLVTPRGTISGTVLNVEGAAGTDKNDTLIGNSGINNLDPGLGSDLVNGKGGAHNTMDNSVKDRVSYWADSNAAKGIKVTTSTIANPDDSSKWIPVANVTDMSGGKDTLLDISYVVGSMANDSFVGNNTKYDDTKYYESEFSGLQGADTIKGGIFTRITYAFDPFAVSVNLDKKNITNLKGQVVAKGTAIDGFSTIDKLSNISGVRGSPYDDFINGGLKAESLNGHSGNDLINGNGGDDLIWGFTGEDKISGGLGIDLLVGDHYINQTNIEPREADHFIFQNATESSGNKKIMAILESNLSSAFVGDIVLDLSAGDIVDLSGIDADSIQSGNQTFTFTAGGVFTKKTGEIIVQNANLTLSSDSSNNNYHFYSSSFRTSIADNDLTNTGVLLMGDVNGDGAADFSIFFVGVSSTTIFNNTFLL